ncbi:DUF4202 domain-containing protein [Rhodonellum sp.]|uniref:DUF4202 domain-containing protein n=1 Tax=Rhodonellum sp. TaxID=2231180 RepID=UPI00271CF5CF|nr:DUF4202 domain-containing protein [Rhodonellum sp.]MDO9553445.1 DUF4202 domain-containing protein [Rhodonellum sp.]
MADIRFAQTLEEIDKINAEDPNLESWQGKEYPKELLYSQRMSAMLQEFLPNASETLTLAARAQHIRRWSIPRDAYPMDRKGYLQWRTSLKKFHGDLASSIMEKQRYSDTEIQKVTDLINKRRLKTDEDAQALEDVICLVFLQYYFDDFILKHAGEEEKIITIVQKTWNKMSPKGHDAALKLKHSEKALKVIGKALAG